MQELGLHVEAVRCTQQAVEAQLAGRRQAVDGPSEPVAEPCSRSDKGPAPERGQVVAASSGEEPERDDELAQSKLGFDIGVQSAGMGTSALRDDEGGVSKPEGHSGGGGKLAAQAAGRRAQEREVEPVGRLAE